MSVWLPVAFLCFIDGACLFYSGNLSISIEQCQAQNRTASQAMQTDKKVRAYQVDCLEITPKQTDSL